MSGQVKTLCLIAKRDKAEAQELAAEVRRKFPDLDVLAEGHLAQALGWPSHPDAELAQRAELLVVLGGDGTLIRAARFLGGRPVPILGVNLGSLGFLTEVPREGLVTALEAFLQGKCKVDGRMKLSCRLVRAGKEVLRDEVLNDVVINKGALARIADHDAYVDNEYVATYKSDGVIVATPTGSTAYSMSAGGPIVHPSLDGIVLSPICPHALTQRPIVIPSDEKLRIVLTSEVADVYLTLDGQAGHALQQGDEVWVQRSQNQVHLVRNPSAGYFSILRQKLHWGER